MSDDKPQSFDDIIRELQHRAPFSPFSIIMSSGDHFRVDDPFMMVNGPVEVFYAVPHSGQILRLRKNQIVGIEEHSARSAA